ncbi:MAG: hypothetical protein ABSB76_20780 [Streptosporangiaceae bacterium]|jgi:hypothetical protein
MPFTGSQEQQADKPVRSAPRPARPGVPPWGPVLATTVRLWGARRLHRLRRSRRAWLVATCVLAVSAVSVLGTVAVIAVVQLTGTSSGQAARVPASGRASQSPLPRSGSARSSGTAEAGAQAAAVRAQAAAWIAGQVGGDQTIACDPSMCTALSTHGVASSRLRSLPPSAPGAPGADIVVASPSAHAWLSADAPTLLASVGSGAQLIEVRDVSPGGAAAYQAALRADLAARRSAGTQLMHSRRIEVSAQGAGQLATGEVDTRLLVLLAVLASQHSWRVIAFGDASPGVPLTEAPYRQVIIAAADDGGGTAGLAAALAVLHAQHGLYQPAQVTTVRLAGGQTGLRIDFAAPSPLGLLAGSTPG